MTDVLERRCRLCGAAVSAKSTFCSHCGAEVQHASAANDELADQIRALFAGEITIDREIGRGSMAAVYLGFDPHLERRVAIKVLLPDVAGDSEIADRFRREAKLVAALNHPNVIPIYGLRAGGALSAIIMQFVDGNSLDVVLRKRDGAALPLPLAGLILSQVAAGLEHAHTRGIVHRDVKPANVLLDPSGQALVSDFGIARRYGGTNATGSGVLLGSASYMSPEQCLGRRADAASDQYALGVVAFELLAGRRPFVGRTSDVLRAQINDRPPSLSALRPELSPELERFVMRMLEKDPTLRHPHLRDAERFFRRLVPDESFATTQLKQVSLRAPMEASPRATTDEPPLSSVAPRSGRTLRLVAVGAGVGLAVLAGAILLRPASRVDESPLNADSAMRRDANGVATAAASSTRKTSRIAARATAGSTSAVQQGREATRPTAAVADPGTTPPTDTGVRRDTAVVAIRSQGEPQPTIPAASAPSTPVAAATATAADARAVASEFLTWCNHRQWRDVDRLPALAGSADLRNQLIDLIRKAPDFQAGFERLASQPTMSDHTFTTDFVLDLEWREGQRQLQVTVRAELSNAAWHVAGFGVQPAD